MSRNLNVYVGKPWPVSNYVLVCLHGRAYPLAGLSADTYKTLDTSDKDRHVVLAYGLQNNKHKNIEEEMIRHETGKLLM